jgi:hypothetical protein
MRFGTRPCKKSRCGHHLSVADAVLAAKAKQKTPEGYYNVERMLKGVLIGKGAVLLCGTCMDARGISDSEIMECARQLTRRRNVEADRFWYYWGDQSHRAVDRRAHRMLLGDNLAGLRNGDVLSQAARFPSVKSTR